MTDTKQITIAKNMLMGNICDACGHLAIGELRRDWCTEHHSKPRNLFCKKWVDIYANKICDNCIYSRVDRCGFRKTLRRFPRHYICKNWSS